MENGTSNSQDRADTPAPETELTSPQDSTSTEPTSKVDISATGTEAGAAAAVANAKEKAENNKSSSGILAMWKQFGDDTSMHGLGRAVNSARVWKKVIWSILVLGAAGIASRNLYLTFVDYFSYPVSTTVNLNVQEVMDFPSVTLCNLNSYRMSPLREDVKERLERSVMEGNSVQKQMELFTILFSKNYDVYTLPQEIKHSMKSMLIYCQFNLESCSDIDFLSVPNARHGPCYTFNYDLSMQRKSYRAGNKNGLILEMDVEQDDYLPFTQAAGLKVLIHPPDVVPFPHEGGIVVRPGVSTSIGIRKVDVKRQIPPWGTCIKAEDTKRDDMNMFRGEAFNAHAYGYSQMACEKTCYQLELKQQCDCCDISYPCFSMIQDCNQTQKEVLDCQNQVRNEYLSGKLGCGAICLPPCQETIFRSSYSVAAWPSERYAANFNKKAGDARLKVNNTKQVTEEELRKNFVRLEVYYETLTEETIVASPAYNWNKLLSDLGGQLGLWMGFSLMTAIEFLELGWDFMGKLCCNVCGACRSSAPTTKV